MAYTTIKKPSDYFNTVNYTGTGATQTISGVGHQPDFIWTKGKSAFYAHNLRDTVRGITKKVKSESTGAEQTTSDGITSVNSDGFVLGADTAGTDANEVNQSGQNYVAWNWLANGSGSANTDGTISSTVSANTTSGFSVVSYTGTGTASDTVGHGLGVTPAMIIVKNRTEATSWCVTHKSLTTDKVLRLEGTNAEGDIGDGELDSPPNNSSTFGFNNGTSGTPLKVVNESSDNYIAYCFADVQGYSKFGSYTGNGNADGTFIYTGFKPAFVTLKVSSGGTGDWQTYDNKRAGYNEANYRLKPSTNEAEVTTAPIDILSNGFKIRTTGGSFNTSGYEYIYMAFAEQPLVGDNPATAR